LFTISVKTPNLLLPETQVVEMGSTALFTCVTRNPVVWKFKGDKLPNKFIDNIEIKDDGDKQKLLFVHRADRVNEGLYSCEIEGGDYLVLSGESSLIIVSKLISHLQPKMSLTLVKGRGRYEICLAPQINFITQ